MSSKTASGSGDSSTGAAAPASIATNLVMNELPRATDTFVKILSIAAGRDAVYKTIGNWARFVAFYLQQQNKYDAGHPTVQSYMRLSTMMGLSRKALSAGRPIEFIRLFQKIALSSEAPVPKFATAGKILFMAIFLSHDFVGWLVQSGVITVKNLQQHLVRGVRFWFAALCLSIVASLDRLRMNSLKLNAASKKLREQQDEDGLSHRALTTLRAERTKLVLTVLADLGDLMMPATVLGYLKLDVAYASLAASGVGLYTLYNMWEAFSPK